MNTKRTLQKREHEFILHELNRHTFIITISSSNIITLIIHQHDKFTADIKTLTPDIPHHSFLTSLIVLKILTYKASSAIMIPSPSGIYSVLNQNFERRRIPPTNRPTRIPTARWNPDPVIHS